MTDKPMMKCGDAAQGTDGDGNPVCIVHVGVTPDARIVADAPPSLEGRMARCSYANRPEHAETHPGGGRQYAGTTFNSTRPSSVNLAFFAHKPDQAEDSFYCGCWGWD